MRTVLCAVLAASLGCQASSTPSADDGTAAVQPQSASGPDASASASANEEWDAERVYTRWRDRFSEDPTLAQAKGEAWTKMEFELKRVANEAGPAHLRANAALLLGVIHEERGERRIAIAHYRQATKLVSDDAGPYMALALALAAEKQFEEAAKVQKTATELDPDNLENWLALAELLIKSGDKETGAKAYVDYERRRKGLIDGLTLRRKDGKYLIPADERAACAEALASANDEGTAVAFMYALKSDDDALVRETVARMMGVQRFAVYQPFLEAHLKTEEDETVRKSIAWALTEVARDPVAANKSEAPELQPPEGTTPPTEGAPDPAEGAPDPAEGAPTPAEGAPTPAEPAPEPAKPSP